MSTPARITAPSDVPADLAAACLSVCLSVHLRNILCGRVQCTNIKRVPVRQDGETVVQTFLNNQLCWGLEFHLPFDTPDDGSVKDGTSCGTNKVPTARIEHDGG